MPDRKNGEGQEKPGGGPVPAATLDPLTQRALAQLDQLNCKQLNAATTVLIVLILLFLATVYWLARGILWHVSIWLILLLVPITLFLAFYLFIVASLPPKYTDWQKSLTALLIDGKADPGFTVMLIEEAGRSKRKIIARIHNNNWPKRKFSDTYIFPETTAGTSIGHELSAAIFFDSKYPASVLAIKLEKTILIAAPSPIHLMLRNRL